jgi:hypothetical protein
VAESPAKDVRLDQNALTTNAARQQCLAKMFVGFMVAKALDQKLKLELRSAVRPV